MLWCRAYHIQNHCCVSRSQRVTAARIPSKKGCYIFQMDSSSATTNGKAEEIDQVCLVTHNSTTQLYCCGFHTQNTSKALKEGLSFMYYLFICLFACFFIYLIFIFTKWDMIYNLREESKEELFLRILKQPVRPVST